MLIYAIQDRYGNWWSHDIGWTDDPREADRYTYQETFDYNLPTDGIWVRLG